MSKHLLISLILTAGWCLVSADTAQEKSAGERQRSMRATMDAILAECQNAAGGDWRKWFDNLAPFREQLGAVMDREARLNVRRSSLEPSRGLADSDATKPHRPSAFLTAPGKPPLMASYFSGFYVRPVDTDPLTWGDRLSSVAALKATRQWLKTKGVDLIVVPVPTVVDVYPDRIVDSGTPPDGLVQPHVRKIFYDLLRSDVEVLDILPALVEARRNKQGPLFLVGDIHWGPVSWSITVDALAERLRRYSFAQDAARTKPLFTSKRMPLPSTTPPTLLWEYLSAAEKEAIKDHLHPEYEAVSPVDKKASQPETSPVVILGDSYAPMISMQLSKALNLPVATHSVDGSSTQPIKELMRTPKGLSEARVVIWIASYSTYLLMDWSGLPDVIRQSGDSNAAAPTTNLAPSPESIESLTQRFTLPSGMKIIMCPKKTRGTAIACAMNIHYGTPDTLAHRAAAAQLMPQMLMRGNKNRNRQELQDELKKLESRVTISGSGASTVVAVTTIRDNLRAVLTQLYGILQSPAFPESEFEDLRQAMIASLEKNSREPQFLALNALTRRLNPYPPGDIRQVQSAEEQVQALKMLTRRDVATFYTDFFGGSNAEFSLVGDFEPSEVRLLVTELFGNWKSPGEYRDIPRRYAKITPDNQVIETPGKNGAVFGAGLTIDLAETDEAYPALLIGTQIFGAGAASRFSKRLREKEGLQYSTAANLGAGSTEKGGLLLVLALNPNGAPEDISRIEQAFREELSLALKNGFGSDEVSQAKAAWLRLQQGSRLQDSSLAQKLASNESARRTMAWDAALEKKVAGLTAGEILNAMRQNLNPDDITAVKAADFQRNQRTQK